MGARKKAGGNTGRLLTTALLMSSIIKIFNFKVKSVPQTFTTIVIVLELYYYTKTIRSDLKIYYFFLMLSSKQ